MTHEHTPAGRPTGNDIALAAAIRRSAPAAASTGILTSAILGVLAATVSQAPAQAANSTAAQAQRQYDIPAGGLDRALKNFASQSGVMLSADATLTAGKSSPGLKGSYTVARGFAALLSGSGLEAVESGAGNYLVQVSVAGRDASTDTQTLNKIQVQDTATDATTEGSRSYTSGAVTIGKTAHALREIPQSVSVVTRQRIEDQNMTTLKNAMDQVTGVTATDVNGNGTSYYYSRGGYLAAQYDGVPSVEGFDNSQEFDLAVYDRIEVLRGPDSLLQGSGTTTGIANMIRKRPQPEFAAKAGLSAGSWNNYRAELDVTNALNDSGSVRGRAVAAGVDRDFYYDYATEKRWTVYGIVEFDATESTTIGLSLASQDGDQTPSMGLPAFTTGEWLPVSRSTFIGPHWTNVWRNIDEGVIDLTQRLGSDWTLKATVRQRQWDTTRWQFSTGRAVDPVTYLTDFELLNISYAFESVGADVNVAGSVELFGRLHELLFGYNMDRRDQNLGYGFAQFLDRNVFDSSIDKSQLPAVTTRSASKIEQGGFYSTARIKLLDSLTAVVGGRLSDYTTWSRSIAPTATPWSKSKAEVDAEFTPFGALVWDVTPQISAYASYADSFSPQSTIDFFGKVLEPIVGWQVETGLKGEFLDGRLHASLAFFRIRNENEAILDPDATHVGCDSDGTCSVAGGLSESDGWELEVSGSPLPGWDVALGYSDNDTEIKKDIDAANVGQPINSGFPSRMLKIWNTYRFEQQFGDGVLAGLSAGFGVQSNSRIYTNNFYVVSYGFTPVEQSGYTVLNAQLGYRFNEKLHASLTVNNLTDRVYFDRINDARRFNYYGEPRNATLSVRASFK